MYVQPVMTPSSAATEEAAVATEAALDEAAAALEGAGVATLPVAARVERTHCNCFLAARAGFCVLSKAGDGHPATLAADADSANASGMHRVGALSNYNACREGFIFSNGATLDLSEAAGFDAAMQSFFASALAIARFSLHLKQTQANTAIDKMIGSA